jgi:chemotaxis protein MotA
MFAIVGILVVFAAVVGGFLMEKGNLANPLQPAELVIIGGAALGTLLAANPPYVLKGMGGGLAGILGGSKLGRQRYLETLRLMYELLNKARREGMLALEADIEKPGESKLFEQYPWFLKDHHLLHFVCDTMRMAVTGGVDAFEMDQMMELDMEVCHQESSAPIAALTTVADSLPGLGIVAAVLGVVITMGALGGPPEQVGHKVAAALVGTFLGILLCYGVIGPLGANMNSGEQEHRAYLHVMRVLLLAFFKGSSPMIAVEMGRRAIPARVRPAFAEMEAACRNQPQEAPAEAAAA